MVDWYDRMNETDATNERFSHVGWAPSNCVFFFFFFLSRWWQKAIQHGHIFLLLSECSFFVGWCELSWRFFWWSVGMWECIILLGRFTTILRGVNVAIYISSHIFEHAFHSQIVKFGGCFHACFRGLFPILRRSNSRCCFVCNFNQMRKIPVQYSLPNTELIYLHLTVDKQEWINV